MKIGFSPLFEFFIRFLRAEGRMFRPITKPLQRSDTG